MDTPSNAKILFTEFGEVVEIFEFEGGKWRDMHTAREWALVLEGFVDDGAAKWLGSNPRGQTWAEEMV